jgi:GNAT superfamily N-acetyltransferase
VDIRAVKKEELPNLISRVSVAFKYPEGERIDRDFPIFFSKENLPHLWVATEENQVIAHSGAYFSSLRIEGEELPVGGIGGVYSEEEHRGKHAPSLLIEKCCEDLKSRGAALAFLWTGEHAYFRKQHFELVGRQWMINIPLEDAKRLLDETGTDDGEVRDTVGAEFFQKSLALFTKFPLGTARSLDVHSRLLSSTGCRVLSFWKDLELKAYLVIGKGFDLQGYVHEWAGEEKSLHALLAHAADILQRDLVVLSPQFTPDEAPWVYALEKLGFKMQPGFMGMVRLLNFAKLRTLACKHVESLGLDSKRLIFEQDGEGYTLGWDQPLFPDLTEREFLKTVFGPELTGVEMWDGLFPLRLWFWGMDSV